MKDERKRRASRRVLKKLSAVRAVLSNDEREVLDAIVLGEVRAHQIPETQIDQSTTESTSTNQRKGQNMLGKDNPISKSTARNTAKAHVMNKVANKGASRVASRNTAKAHQMVTTELPAEQAPVTTVPPIELPKVEFDPTVEQYKPIPE